MLKKILQSLLVILVVSILDFVLTFVIGRTFSNSQYTGKSIMVDLLDSWLINSIISFGTLSITAFIYLCFYFFFINNKYFAFYKKWGGLVVLFVVIICFMGSFIFAFATSIFAVANLLRICASAWLVTFLITKTIEKPSSAFTDN